MAEKKKFKSYRISILRITTQIISFILIFGGSFSLAASFIVLPIMAPLGNPYTTVAGAWQLMEFLLTMAIFPFIAITVIALGSLLIGRAFCGWVCPFGFISDVISYLGKKKRVSNPTNNALYKLSIFIAAVFIFIDVTIGYNEYLGSSIYGYFGDFAREPSSIIDPTSTIFSLLFWYVAWGLYPKNVTELTTLVSYPLAFWFRIFVLIIAILMNYFVPRAWCRWICPLGGLMSIGTPYKLVKVYLDPSKCLGPTCSLCVKSCPMGIPILDYKGHSSNPLCISCLKCLEACPTKAISVKI